MTTDQIIASLLGLVLSGLVTWLGKTVLSLSKDMVVQKALKKQNDQEINRRLREAKEERDKITDSVGGALKEITRDVRYSLGEMSRKLDSMSEDMAVVKAATQRLNKRD